MKVACIDSGMAVFASVSSDEKMKLILNKSVEQLKIEVYIWRVK